jgi:hypothetical protein
VEDLAVKRRARSRAWAVHGGMLAILAVVFLVAFADAFPNEPGLGAALLGVPVLAYALITTLVMAFAGRSPAAALIVHASVIGVWVACAYFIMADRRAVTLRMERQAREQQP